jgi:hypothetical protein
MKRLLGSAALCAAMVAAASALADSGPRFFAVASGAQEVPEVVTDAFGRVDVAFDAGLSSAQVRLRLRGITSAVLAAHFHCAPAGVNGPVAFGLLNPGPLTEIGELTRLALTNADGVDTTDDSETGCSASIGRDVGNIAALFQAMDDGLIYLNVHTADHQTGEVRGQMLKASGG